MEEGHGYSDDRKAARDALLALLGAGVLVAAAPARQRKALGLLAILAVLALFLWRRAQAATESAQAVAPEWERETESSESEEVAVEAPVAEAAVEEVAVEEAVVEQAVVEEEAVVEETVAEEAPAEAATAPAEAATAETPAEEPSEFEALDAALTALIGELERVEASRLEEARIDEAQRAWREAQAEDARERQEVGELGEESALVHAGRQLVHAGGSDMGGWDTGDRDAHDGVHLPESEQEAEEANAVEPAATEAANGEAWRGDPRPVEEPVAVADEVASQAVAEVTVQETVAPEVEVAPAPVTATPATGGLIGLIGRYSHRETAGAEAQPPVATPPLAVAPGLESATEEPSVPPVVKPARPAEPESDWL